MNTGAVAVRPVRRARPNVKRIVWTVVGMLAAVLVVGYIGIGGYIASKLIVAHPKAATPTPAQFGMANYQDIQFTSSVDNVALKGWYIDSPGDKVIVMLHGWSGWRADTGIGTLEISKQLVDHNYDVMMFDWRAHGESSGDRYTLGQNEVRDVAGALNYLKTNKNVDRVGTVAFSMGAATSLLAAPNQPEIKAMWVDSPYADLPELLNTQLPLESKLPAFFNPGILLMSKLLYGLDVWTIKPVESMAALSNRPMYHVHSSSEDVRIDITQAYKLRDAAANRPNYTFWEANTKGCEAAAGGRGHVKAFQCNKDEYAKRLITFFDTNFQ